MAQKRKANEAFGQPKAVSAFEAARQARQPQVAPEDDLATSLAEAPYDGHVEDFDGVNENVVQPPLKRNIRLSTWKPSKKNVLRDDDEGLEISMKVDECVTFVGEFDLEILSGVVSFHGAMLHPNSRTQRVYALATSALPAITAKKASAIRISSVSRSITCLDKYSPLFRNLGAHDEKGRSFKYLASTADDPLQRSLSPLEIDEDTKRVLSRINGRLEAHERPRIVAVGPKSAGKSTFNRLLCNMIVTRPSGQKVAYLDIDPGQPEFGAPGQVSVVEVSSPILGPPFTHPATLHSSRYRLIRSHNIAATSFKDDPDNYVNCVLDLARHVPKNTPLIVNSCGWVNGTGAAVLLQLLAQLRITGTISLQPLDPEHEEAMNLVTDTSHTIGKRAASISSRTPAEQRAMQTMALFHSKNKGPETATWIDKPISKMRPWMVSYSGSNSGIAAILSYHQAPHPNFLGEVLDGMVVAIVVPDEGLINPDDVERTPKEDLPYIISNQGACSLPLDPRQSHCVGIALVRGIDLENRRLLLVTALSDAEIAELMQRQIVLVRGNFDAPEWAYLEDIYQAENSTVSSRGAADEDDRPWVSFREPVGIEGSVWRLRHPPMAADVKKNDI